MGSIATIIMKVVEKTQIPIPSRLHSEFTPIEYNLILLDFILFRTCRPQKIVVCSKIHKIMLDRPERFIYEYMYNVYNLLSTNFASLAKNQGKNLAGNDSICRHVEKNLRRNQRTRGFPSEGFRKSALFRFSTTLPSFPEKG